MSAPHSELVEISKLNGDFKKHYGKLLCGYLYLRSISAARRRSYFWGGSLVAVLSTMLAWLQKNGLLWLGPSRSPTFSLALYLIQRSSRGTPSYIDWSYKFKSSGDLYDRLIELPTFAHSDNHAGLQVADAICSALLTPIAVNTTARGTFKTCMYGHSTLISKQATAFA